MQLARQFNALWESSTSPPDVFDFLAKHADAGPEELVDVLLVDQRHRWQTDSPLKVEDYLRRFPRLEDASNCRLKLAIAEFQHRLPSDSPPSIEHFTERFSDISSSLKPQLVQALCPDADQYSTDVADFIGRYRLLRLLGKGAFGTVWLAFDPDLHRQVAIKVPNPERFSQSKDVEAYLIEARTLARLDHPHIVPVYDVGRTRDGSIYVVSKFISGGTLADRIERDLPDLDEAARLVAICASALGYSHEMGFIHRDVKPANILIEEGSGTPYVADFGLAIREEDLGRQKGFAGTPTYMSPEQARGESHRLDGRSDVFSLGLVLYELLTGTKPFQAESLKELLQKIATVDPPPPREIDESIPAELERVCLKAISKRASDRYANGNELANDLLHWNRSIPRVVTDLPIVPKGLRSFDATDSDYFLDLLPGPRNRNGLPESVQFWKTRLEETNPDKTFAVGLIYGPSGCGKSSMVKAGLLPRLAPNVASLYLEATPNETETQLMQLLRHEWPKIRPGRGLVETFSALRRKKGRKVVIVLDQFEQWLHAHRGESESELVSALRQCDGARLQAVLMVRDDFWLNASRLMQAAEVQLVTGHNVGLVDLFDIDHAQKVLTKFGQAFERLPERTSDLSDAERKFVTSVSSGLARDGKVVPIRLSLFAEMVKGKPWAPATLKEVGGTDGVGVNFLEETFGRRSTNPSYRQHAAAAREVLKSLLPDLGSDIKGHSRSHAELTEVSGCGSEAEFEELLRMLDAELRLITPTDTNDRGDSGADSKLYQLSHDYLVPSLREWLTKKQQESRRGRAELRLAERSELWSAKPERRQLPNLLEWLYIRALTNPKQWSDVQRAMMRKTVRTHLSFWGMLALAVSFLGLILWLRTTSLSNADQPPEPLANDLTQATPEDLDVAFSAASIESRFGSPADRRSLTEILTPSATPADPRAGEIERAVSNLISAKGAGVSPALRGLKSVPRAPAVERLRQQYPSSYGREQLLLAYGLVHLGELEFLDTILTLTADIGPSNAEVMNVVTVLDPHKTEVLPQLRAASARADRRRDWLSKVRYAVISWHLGDVSIASDMLRAFPTQTPSPTTEASSWDPIQRTSFISAFPTWCGDAEQLVHGLDSTIREDVKSGISLALGGISSPSATTKNSWSAVLSSWYGGSPDGGTHSAAGWALSKWGLPLPTVNATESPKDGQNWWHTRTGIRMVRIPAGDVSAERNSLKIEAEYWLSDCEVNGALYKRFLNDQNYKGLKPSVSEPEQAQASVDDLFGAADDLFGDAPQNHAAHDLSGNGSESVVDDATPRDADHPVQSIGFYDAVMFCNWLSIQESLSHCYEIEADRAKPGEYTVRLVRGASGFRLPTSVEWEYACRAMTTTAYSFGDDAARLPDYGYFSDNSDRTTAVCGTLRCSPWGLFDMHGNVWEWCWDITDGDLHVNRGGSWINGATYCTSSYVGGRTPNDRTGVLGFRVAASPNSAPKSITNSVGMTLNLIPNGSFLMGSPTSEQGRDEDETQHRVTLARDFYLGTTEVTQGQWQSVMGTTPWKDKIYVEEGSDYPATYVSWDDAVAFCKKLSERDGRTYRLPTEAEWEYACRAGSAAAYSFGASQSSLKDYAWYDENAWDVNERYAHLVGAKRANAYGLYDMHGNVWEWCGDWYGDYPSESVTDPRGASQGSDRVRRGGGWDFIAWDCRSADRDWSTPGSRSSYLGFRVAVGR